MASENVKTRLRGGPFDGDSGLFPPVKELWVIPCPADPARCAIGGTHWHAKSVDGGECYPFKCIDAGIRIHQWGQIKVDDDLVVERGAGMPPLHTPARPKDPARELQPA